MLLTVISDSQFSLHYIMLIRCSSFLFRLHCVLPMVIPLHLPSKSSQLVRKHTSTYMLVDLKYGFGLANIIIQHLIDIS
uniref:Uncharacterized protein n=1 Tax=Rhizophora mucronata TaxID=61149 RepID=A0A2P2NII9_RHIMU